MKRIFYLSMLFLLSISVVKAENPYGFNGVFTDIDNYKEIVIKSYKRGLKVQGLKKRNRRGWVKFEREGRFIFVDCDGNYIKLLKHRRRAKIIYKSRRGYTRIFEEGVIRPSYGGSCGSGYGAYNYNNYDDWDDGFHTYNYHDDHYGNNNHGHNGRDRNRRADRYSFEGTYETNEGRQIAILNTRTGFKAKFSGERVWKTYSKTGDRFEDRDGNYYELIGSNQMKWIGKYSGKTRVINKLSDEVRF